MIICYLRLIAINYLFRLYLCHDGLLIERRTYRDALEDAGTPKHPHNTNLREDHSGESEPRYGETLPAYRADGELYLSSDLMNLKLKSDEKRKKHHYDR